MLVFTNRRIEGSGKSASFGRAFAPGQEVLSFADATPASGGGDWSLKNPVGEAGDAAALATLAERFAGGRPVLVYLHGNNNTPQACFERCALLARLYKVEVIGFSWPAEGYQADGSEAPDAPNDEPGNENELARVSAGNRSKDPIRRKIQRYLQAKLNAQISVDALARFLRLVAAARLQTDGQPYSLAAHSLGAHFLQYTLEIAAAREALGSAYNIALLAACVRAPGHAEWVARLRPRGRVFVTFNPADSVLLGAFIADGSQAFKLGAEPGTPLVDNGIVRYVDFSSSAVGLGGHAYFVYDGLLKKTKKLFARIFASEPDLRGGEAPNKVYALGCAPDGVTCYIGTSVQADAGGG